MAVTFSDNFSPQSTLWSNYTWSGTGEIYYGNGNTLLPLDFSNSSLSLTVTINSLRDDGIWLDTDGTTKNGILLVLGGNGGGGNWAYWHIAQNGSLSTPLDINTNAFVPDLTYTVTVLVNGNTYQAYKDPDGVFDANSVLLTTLIDNTFTHGQVGLYDISSASFSNFSATGITDDYSASTSTTGVVLVGGSAAGTIETSGDLDWFAVTLVAGTTYQFDLQGLPNPALHLQNASGGPITSGSNSITYTPSTSGTFYLACAESDNAVGNYTVSATAIASSTPAPTFFSDNFAPPSTLWSNYGRQLDRRRRDLLRASPQQWPIDVFWTAV